jgi:molecular chaperone GrpE
MDEDKAKQEVGTSDTTGSDSTAEVLDEETVLETQEQSADDGKAEVQDAASTDAINKANAACEEMKQKYLRLQADFTNFKKRTAGEKLQISEVVKMDVLSEILPILDNFERALQVPQEGASDDMKSFLDGYQMIYNQLITALQKEGLQKMEAVGKPFDPNYHQAVMRVPSDEYEDDVVVEVLQAGYLLGEKTLRPAMVKVAFNG